MQSKASRDFPSSTGFDLSSGAKLDKLGIGDKGNVGGYVGEQSSQVACSSSGAYHTASGRTGTVSLV